MQAGNREDAMVDAKPPVVDTAARRRTAELYRHFATGRITNFELEEKLEYRDGLYDIWWLGIWPAYHDGYEHKLVGKHKLTREGKGFIARIILFLHSDFPYRWRRGWRARTFWEFALAIASFGLSVVALRTWIKWTKPVPPTPPAGDEEVWPFFTREEYEEALANPHLLVGASRRAQMGSS